jgi:ABC-type dipeptide/oligopeptide/nickel transport system permease component
VRYIARRILWTIVWVVGGTGLAWLAIWLKVRAETQDKPVFHTWIVDNLWQIWKVNHEDIAQAVTALGHTLILVVCAILVSGAISIWLGWKTSRAPHARHLDIVDSILSAFGGIPLFFLCFLVKDREFEVTAFLGRHSIPSTWIVPVLAVAILAWGEGNGSLWVRTFRRQFGRLRRAPHIIAAQARGLPIARRLWRDIAGVLVESLGSRMVLLLGGAAIIESILNLDDGIGYAIIKQFTEWGTSYSALAAQSLVLVTVTAVLRGFDVVARDWIGRAGAVQV